MNETRPHEVFRNKLGSLLDRVQELLGGIRRLEEERRKNSQRRQRQECPHDVYLQECARLHAERRAIITQVRPRLLRDLWELIPDLAISHAEYFDLNRRYEELLGHVPEEPEPEHDEWVTDFLLGLRDLLRWGAESLGDPRCLTAVLPTDELQPSGWQQEQPTHASRIAKVDRLRKEKGLTHASFYRKHGVHRQDWYLYRNGKFHKKSPGAARRLDRAIDALEI